MQNRQFMILCIALIFIQLKIFVASLQEWMKNAVRGVWFKVNLGNSSYIPILVKVFFFKA